MCKPKEKDAKNESRISIVQPQ
uniref:Uncharacterized protein n=1 Tax=Wuchereria bancrofti TaxID=6293 RepID=A0AAF5PT54_WUCBA